MICQAWGKNAGNSSAEFSCPVVKLQRFWFFCGFGPQYLFVTWLCFVCWVFWWWLVWFTKGQIHKNISMFTSHLFYIINFVDLVLKARIMIYHGTGAEVCGVLLCLWSRIRSHTMQIVCPVCETKNHHGYLSDILHTLSHACVHTLSLFFALC